MQAHKMTAATEDIRARLSGLWIVVMSALLAADVLSSYIPGAHAEMAEFAGETPIPLLMLGGAIMMAIPIVMIYLSRVLPHRVNRWANIIAAVITILFVTGWLDLSALYFPGSDRSVESVAYHLVCMVVVPAGEHRVMGHRTGL